VFTGISLKLGTVQRRAVRFGEGAGGVLMDQSYVRSTVGS
jgi:hypothetical protein